MLLLITSIVFPLLLRAGEKYPRPTTKDNNDDDYDDNDDGKVHIFVITM